MRDEPYQWDTTPAAEYWEREGRRLSQQPIPSPKPRKKVERRVPPPKVAPNPRPCITWGTEVQTGKPFHVELHYLDSSHMHTVAASNRGKSKKAELEIRQLLPMPNRGGMVLDVEGTLVKSLLNWLAHHPDREELAKRVIIISPTLAKRTGMWPGFNPFLTTDGSPDLSVEVKHQVGSVLKIWGKESLDMPTFERVAKTIFWTASEAKLTISQLQYLLSSDKSLKPVREKIAQQVSAPAVRSQLQEWEDLARRSIREWKAELLSFQNRYSAFSDVRAVQLIMDRLDTLDMKEIIEGSLWVLVDASQDEGLLSAEDGYLICSFLINKVVDYGFKRSEKAGKERPFYLFEDEFQELLHPDIPRVLNRMRKRGIHQCASHQTLAQVYVDDPKLMSSVLQNSDIKVVMGLGDPADAEMAERYLFSGTHDPKELKDEVRNPLVVDYLDEKVTATTKATTDADIESYSSISGLGSSSMSMFSPEGEFMGGLFHSDPDLLSSAQGDSSFSSDSSSFGSVHAQSQAVSEGTRLRPVLEERGTSRTYYTPEEQRMRNQAALLGLPPQYAYIKVQTAPPVLVKIANVTEYPEDEQLLMEFWEMCLTAHHTCYLHQDRILELQETRRIALEAPPEEDQADAYDRDTTPISERRRNRRK